MSLGRDQLVVDKYQVSSTGDQRGSDAASVVSGPQQGFANVMSHQGNYADESWQR